MSGALPDYLKSLENLLGTSVSATVTPESTAKSYTTPAATSSPAASLTLDKIGFGSMFTKPAEATASDKLRFMLVSTHVQQFTGYSKVTHGILSELAKQPWLDITHFGIQKFHDLPPSFRPYPAGIDVIDATSLEKPVQNGFAFGALPDAIRKKKPQVVMIYNDMAVVTQFVEAIRKSGIPRNFQLWVYCDQVYNTQTQVFLDILNRDADRIFAFTPYWKKCLKDQGVTRPVDVLLHGYNTKQCFPVPKELARKQLSLPADMFLFMNMNRNQPRKRYDILIMAFVELVVKYPTKPLFLLCICDKGEKGGWWLFELFSRELKLRGVPIEQFAQRLIITAQNMSFKDDEINMFYNAADVGISTSDGEGWGLCQFEQMGVGVPQVVPDIGGYKEFCTADNSVLVKPTVRYYLPSTFSPVGGEALACNPHDVCVGMEEYVLNSEKREAHGRAAREKVLGYTWEKACDVLVRRLKSVKEDDD
jgi:glycosyltransferase involved in cell wall biosynthesis